METAAAVPHDGCLSKLMLKVVRDLKMMPNDVMSNGKTVARNAFEHVRWSLQNDVKVKMVKTTRRRRRKGNADTV